MPRENGGREGSDASIIHWRALEQILSLSSQKGLPCQYLDFGLLGSTP